MTETASAVTGNPQPDAAAKVARRSKALEGIFGSDFVHTFQSPYMVIDDHVIESPVAIRFYKKDFNYLSKQLYLEYQYRNWQGFNAELLDKYAAIITAKLTAIDTLMQNNINRLSKLLQQQGYQADLTLWPNVHRCDVPIIAAQARAYIAVLQKMDRLNALSGTANLLGVIDSAQRQDVEFTAKRAVRAFRSILQHEVVRLYREAERIIQVQRQSGKVDVAMAAVLSEQGKDIAEFEASSEQEHRDDASMSLNGATPEDFIADAVAVSNAAAAAAGAPKRAARPRKPEATGAPDLAPVAAGTA